MATEVTLSPEFLAFARRSRIEPVGPPSIRANDVVVQGVRLRYLDWFGPANRAVVFVHGGGLTARTWDLVCLGLRERYHCLALDLRGHGDSEWAADLDYRLETFAEDLALFSEREVLQDAVLVGHSLGGTVSLLCAAGRLSPRGLVLVDVGPEPNLAGAQRIIDAIHRPWEFEQFDDAVEQALALNPRRERDVLRDSLRNNLRRLPNGRWAWKYDWRAFSLLTPELRREHATLLWDAVERVRCPVLVVRGSESDVFSDAQAKQLCARVADCQLQVVEDAGHTVQGDNPAGLVRQLEQFLPRCFAGEP